MKKIILASQSLQRKELLQQLIPLFEIHPANIDELAINHPDHGHRAELVARAKGALIAEQFPEALVISADTFVVLNNQRYEKPDDFESANKMLTMFSENTVQVFTGICITQGKDQESGAVEGGITFRHLSPEFIHRYVENNPVTNWAGGFSLRDVAGLSLTSEVTGSVSAVLGLPLEWLDRKLFNVDHSS